MNSQASYPYQLCEAAREFSNSCTAYAHLHKSHDSSGLRIQAPEIMMQFVGDVDFGRDPKGLLFYRSNMKSRHSTYEVLYYKTSTSSIVVRVDFFMHGEQTPFARFLANAKASQLPSSVPGPGHGTWGTLEAVLCPMHVTRPSGSPTVNLGSHAIEKQVYFKSHHRTPISEPGVLFFRDLARLKDQPYPLGGCMAHYTPDRIKFHIENEPDDVVAVYFPAHPMLNIGHGTSRVVWEDICSEAEHESWC
ncbi:hypothetical protein AX14_007896 [Amanita brunnescens Koide BX004]|nr:hypothetical protein AX14_007896 [Amanita brunnescens Koide BX004]